MALESDAYRRCVSVVVRRLDGAVLIGLRASPVRWELPGGFVEAGESFTDGGRRELFEETGVAVGLLSPLLVSLDPANKLLCVTMGAVWDGNLDAPVGEMTKVRWAAPTDAGRDLSKTYGDRLRLALMDGVILQVHSGRVTHWWCRIGQVSVTAEDT